MTSRKLLLGLSIALPLVLVAAARQQAQHSGALRGSGPGSGANRPPLIETNLLQPAELVPGKELRFDIRVVDPEGDVVSLRLLNPPPGIVFHPIHKAASPASTTVRWIVPAGSVERPNLIFRASDRAGSGSSVDFQAEFVRKIRTREGSRILTGDVTGDGLADIIGGALSADVAGVVNAGEVYVWEGANGINGIPHARLSLPGAFFGDQLGFSGDQGIQLVDLSGDGVLDVVLGAQLADTFSAVNAGAIYIFEGGTNLSGTPTPWSTIQIGGANSGDQLGETGMQFEDVTGDGQLDLITGSSLADVGGASNAGEIYIFEGGSGLAGSPLPLATLSTSLPQSGDRLGIASGQGIQIADVTGDAVADIVAGAQFEDFNGITNLGAIHVWEGGSSLSGFLTPSVSLATDGGSGPAAAGDQLGFAAGQGIQLADVTGDGTLDIVAGAQVADHGSVVDSGVVYIWHGGRNLLFSLNPDAYLHTLSPSPGDQLGNASEQGVQLVDVTDDGTLDIVVGAQFADYLGDQDRGALHIYAGGPLLVGDITPTISVDPSGFPNDRLGSTTGQGIQMADLSGDGRLELIVTSSLADSFSDNDVGTIQVWNGDDLATLSGNLSPSITFQGFNEGHQLGVSSGQGVQFADVNGDNQLDMIAGAQFAESSGFNDAGVIHIWEGGSSFLFGSSSTTLEVFGTEAGNRLGFTEGQGIQFADVDGDGELDVIAGAQFADHNGVPDSGAIYVWLSNSLFGSLPSGPPTIVLESSIAQPGDRLGSSSGQAIQFADVTGDGILDILAGARYADLTAIDSGTIFMWQGGPFFSSTENASFASGAASTSDQLGYASVGFLLLDVTGDGLIDLLAGAQEADIAGSANAGAIYLWDDLQSASTFSFPTAELHPAIPSPGDRLGN